MLMRLIKRQAWLVELISVGFAFAYSLSQAPSPSSSRAKAINISNLFPSPAVTFIFVDSGFFGIKHPDEKH